MQLEFISTSMGMQKEQFSGNTTHQKLQVASTWAGVVSLLFPNWIIKLYLRNYDRRITWKESVRGKKKETLFLNLILQVRRERKKEKKTAQQMEKYKTKPVLAYWQEKNFYNYLCLVTKTHSYNTWETKGREMGYSPTNNGEFNHSFRITLETATRWIFNHFQITFVRSLGLILGRETNHRMWKEGEERKRLKLISFTGALSDTMPVT